MDKIFGNDKNSILDKFRVEVGRESEEDVINTRTLTVQPGNPHDSANVSSNDIDRQISDLESLIKRLQDEIVQMSNNNRPIEEAYMPLDVEQDDDTANVYNVSLDVGQTMTSQMNFDYPVYRNSQEIKDTLSDIRTNFYKLYTDESDDEVTGEMNDSKIEKINDDVQVLISELKAEIAENMKNNKQQDPKPTFYNDDDDDEN